jgi:hypothetical protein
MYSCLDQWKKKVTLLERALHDMQAQMTLVLKDQTSTKEEVKTVKRGMKTIGSFPFFFHPSNSDVCFVFVCSLVLLITVA